MDKTIPAAKLPGVEGFPQNDPGSGNRIGSDEGSVNPPADPAAPTNGLPTLRAGTVQRTVPAVPAKEKKPSEPPGTPNSPPFFHPVLALPVREALPALEEEDPPRVEGGPLPVATNDPGEAAPPVPTSPSPDDQSPTLRDRLWEFFLRAEASVLGAIGLPRTTPYLSLMKREINRLEHKFAFKVFPPTSRPFFEELLNPKAPDTAPPISAAERAEVEKLLAGDGADLTKLPDAAFPLITRTFKARLAGGETLDDLLPEAFAVAREACRRAVYMRPFDVQMMGGIIIHNRAIAEMATGEGKTLVAVASAYLNALTGEGAHIVTVNDYLARRDAAWMGPAYKLLGLSVGVVPQEDFSPATREAKRAAYAADVTYVTNHEVIFDYLRDNLVFDPRDRVQRGLNFGNVDEVDCILIDEARTPCIISGPMEEDEQYYRRFASIVKEMKGYEAVEEDKQHRSVDPKIEEEYDYVIYPKSKRVVQTARGLANVEKALGVKELHSVQNMPLLHFLDNALQAQLKKKDQDYVVTAEGEIQIVDEFTGRILPNRRYSDGLHQALEAKEGVPIKGESLTIASITVQNFFKLYKKLGGMTGTAETEAKEFEQVYGLGVVVVPTNKPCIRNKHPDLMFKTKEAKWRGVLAHIARKHLNGQPLLVGTRSIEDSELLSGRLSPELLQRGALVSLLLQALQTYDRNHPNTERARRLLTSPLEAISLEKLGPLAKEMGIDPRVLTDGNLDRLMQLWQIPDVPGPLGKVSETRQKLRHETARERLRTLLSQGIRHEVLNAKHHEREAGIIAQAGRFGAVTIATNMAGRGTDIVLGGDPVIPARADLEKLLVRCNLQRFQDRHPDLYKELGDLMMFGAGEVGLAKAPDGKLVVVTPKGIIPYEELEQKFLSTAGIDPKREEDQPRLARIHAGLFKFFMEPERPLVDLMMPFLPGNPTFDISEPLKGVAQQAKRGTPWEVIRTDPKIQSLLSRSFGPLADAPEINLFFTHLCSAVQQAVKEGEMVKAAGGLDVVGTERHESRRIDNQLGGRGARQGDPGEAHFFLSLEDEVPRLFGTERLKKPFNWLGIGDEEGIEVNRAINTAQQRVEERDFLTRENLKKYDEPINMARKAIYEERNEVLFAESVQDRIKGWMIDLVTERIDRMDQPVPQLPQFEMEKEALLLFLNELGEDLKEKFPASSPERKLTFRLDEVREEIENAFRSHPDQITAIKELTNGLKTELGKETPDPAQLTNLVDALVERAEGLREAQEDREIQLGMLAQSLSPFVPWPAIPAQELLALSKEELKGLFVGRILEYYHALEAAVNRIQPGLMRQIERSLYLTAIDQQWVQLIMEMQALKDGIGLHGYGQRDPLVVYTKEASLGFERMLTRMHEQTIGSLLHINPAALRPAGATPTPESAPPESGRVVAAEPPPPPEPIPASPAKPA